MLSLVSGFCSLQQWVYLFVIDGLMSKPPEYQQNLLLAGFYAHRESKHSYDAVYVVASIYQNQIGTPGHASFSDATY